MALDVELREVRDFLALHAPFDALPARVLDELPTRLTVRYFRRDTPIIARGQDNHHLFVIRSGAVDIRDEHGDLAERAGVGDALGSITLVLGNPSTFEVVAIEDTLTLVMDAPTFYELGRTSHEFAHFFDAQRARRLQGALASWQAPVAGSPVLRTQVRDLMGHPPVTVPARASVREAARAMTEHGVSCLLVVQDDRLVGIVTDRDLRSRVLAVGGDPDGPVDDVMTRDPVTGGPDSAALEVLMQLTARNIHHLPIVADGRPVGVVTATDLMRLERASPVFLVGEITKQTEPAKVAEAAHRLPRIVDAMVGQDVSAAEIGRVVTSVGDAVERTLLALAEQRLGPPPAPYCWVALGSRARQEQALGADQDHALVLADSATPEHDAYFAALADLVADGLREAGYPRCLGDVMATNPRWRMTLREWERTMLGWLTHPVPEAVLDASIFFDMRPVYGDSRLAEDLLSVVARATPQAELFLVHLAKAATRHDPPLGFFRGFVVEKSGAHANTVDVKAGGIGAIVEIARVFALGVGTRAVGTAERVDAAVVAGAIGPDLGQDMRDAFELISHLRLHHQAQQVRRGEPPDNHVAPDDLRPADRRHLREAFGVVRAAQSALSTRYPLQFVS